MCRAYKVERVESGNGLQGTQALQRLGGVEIVWTELVAE